MPPARERERISARVESLTSVISNFGLGPFDAKRIKKVTKESFVREKSDDDYLNWAIDVLTADEDLQWEKSAAVAKEVAKGPKKGLRGGEKRTHVNSNNVALDPPSSFGQEASTELLSLQGNAGMGPASSHPRGSQRLAQELPGADDSDDDEVPLSALYNRDAMPAMPEPEPKRAREEEEPRPEELDRARVSIYLNKLDEFLGKLRKLPGGEAHATEWLQRHQVPPAPLALRSSPQPAPEPPQPEAPPPQPEAPPPQPAPGLQPAAASASASTARHASVSHAAAPPIFGGRAGKSPRREDPGAADSCYHDKQSDAGNDHTRDPPEYLFDIHVKDLSGTSPTTITVTEMMTVLQLKEGIAAKMGLPPAEQKIIYTANILKDTRTVGSYNIQKGCTVQVIPKGRVSAPPPLACDGETGEASAVSSFGGAGGMSSFGGVGGVSSGGGGGGPTASSSTTAVAPCLRRSERTGDQEFDWSDGWAVAEHLNVRAAQRWYRTFRQEVAFEAWKNGNKLKYLLNRSHTFSDEAAAFLTNKMGNTALGQTRAWESVPEAVLDLDRQIRGVMRDPYHGQTPLLGSAEDGAFVLGYVQVSNMPVPLQTEVPHSELDKAKPEQPGRRLGLHNDSAAYGDIIVTVTLYGHVQILLRRDPDIRSELQGLERGQGTEAGDVLVRAGDAYVIFGKARWKMQHDAIVPSTARPIDGLGNIARVGLTFRYFRRSWLEMCQLEKLPAPAVPPPALPALPAVFDVVDARFYSLEGALDPSHLYSYPAVVLRVDAETRTLTLQYVSDGLGADTDWEAFAIASRVPARAVRPAPATVRRLLRSSECSWTRRSQHLLQRIRAEGVDAYLAANGM